MTCYQLYCSEWRNKYSLIHVDKFKLCTLSAPPIDSAVNQPIPQLIVAQGKGIRQPCEADMMGIDCPKDVEDNAL